MEGNNMEV